jgi:hypothetical protein
MTRITERSSAYPGGVRKTRTTNATKFYPFACVAPDTVNSVAPDYYDGDGSIVPIGGSLELAYEPDPVAQMCTDISGYMATGAIPNGSAAASDLDTGDEARDQGPKPADEDAWDRDEFPGVHWAGDK